MPGLGPLSIETPAVMGVLNLTPDSFSDGGRFSDHEQAIRHVEQMVGQGAAIIDIGGESTRPGAEAVGEQQELERVIPIVERVRRDFDIPISIDTSKPGVMRAAVAAGATLINDVRALRADGAIAAAAELGCAVCLMHMRGDPQTMQLEPRYDDVVAEVTQFLRQRVAECVEGGIAADALLVDPGFGFGKSVAHNVALLARLDEICRIGPPVLIGVSRKSTLGALTGRDVDSRLAASLAAAVLAVAGGASVIRAHDVAETVDALKVARAVMEAREGI